MKNGCLCCVSTGTSGGIRGTSRVLEHLVRIRDKGVTELDGVFVELSGLADPSPTILTFLSEAFTRANFYLDGIICMIDSSNLLNHLNTRVVEIERQLSYSTMTLLNKIDLLVDDDKGSTDTKVENCTNAWYIHRSSKEDNAKSSEVRWAGLGENTPTLTTRSSLHTLTL